LLSLLVGVVRDVIGAQVDKRCHVNPVVKGELLQEVKQNLDVRVVVFAVDY